MPDACGPSRAGSGVNGSPSHPRLESTEVLLLDCQTTGAPGRGQLLELAWSVGSAADGPHGAISSELVALPEGVVVPPAVTRVTGISAADLLAARPPEEVWLRLWRDGAGTAAWVAHFTRFERAFLEPLARRSGVETLPTLICTREIACRLLPTLPRRTLRALAGYLGHHTGELRRAAAHVAATRSVWCALVARLASHGVTTLAELEGFLATAPPAGSTRREYPLAKFRRQRLPARPGVYRFVDAVGEVLYVGKAASLHRRVNGYFQKQRRVDGKTLELLAQVRDVRYTVTATALEAALLEVDEIRRLDPPYNRVHRAARSVPAFAASDLRSLRPRSDAEHWIGPLPGETLARAVAELAAGVHGPFLVVALGGARRAEPAGASVAAFRARHGASNDVVELLRIGARAARKRLNDDTREPDAEVVELLARVARVARRARFLGWLAGATLVFRVGSGMRRLELRQGCVARVVDVEEVEIEEGPRPGREAGWRAGQRHLDAAAWARLGVLGAEIRRLVKEDRLVVLLLGNGARLDGARVGRWLPWV